MFVSEFQETIAGLRRIEGNLRHLHKLQKMRNILKIVGIGFFIHKNVEKEIDNNKKERQALLGNWVQKASEYLEYFRTESKKILESNNYLSKDNETRLLSLLDEFNRDLIYSDAQHDFATQISDFLGVIAETRRFVANYNSEFEKRKLRAELLARRDDVLQAVTEYNSLFFGDYYFSKKELHDWKNKWFQLRNETEKCIRKVGKDLEFKEELDRFLGAYNHGEGWLKIRNQEFVEKETAKYKDFFDKVESNPLTSEQKKAILTDEANILVVAGAGTGKTSTIIGKAGYLLKKGLAKPDEILLLCFNKSVRLELEKRLKKLTVAPEATNYHKFGLKIIKHAVKSTPSVSKLAEDKTEFGEKVSEFIRNRMKEPSFSRMVNEYFLYYLIPYKSEFEFDTFGDYIRYLRQYDLRSLKGDRVKSFEECYIANFLFVNGIDYLYEADYEIRTVDENYRQYKPDFYLPKYKIYIEHFGINRERKPAPYIPERKYIEEMNWKIDTHTLNKTKLIQTFSYEQKEGKLLINIEKKLRENNVTFSPIPSDLIFSKLNSLGKTAQLPQLLCNFLNLYKASGKNIQEIQSEVDPEDTRTRAFLKIFSAVYDDYTSHLRKAGEIDFNDMLNNATKYINERKYVSNFKYILVDEFQDISQSRYLFLKALADQNESKLFCVGDDWQSIYRFTGSDISIMVDFQKRFEFSEILPLQETFRFNDKICDFSTRFILQNPIQIKKKITSRILNEKPAVSVIRAKTDVALKDIISNISMKNEKTETVLVIGRYKRLEQEYLGNFPRKSRYLSIEYKTAHSSKGLEADYVIVLGLNGGKLGFPCQITDDSVLNLVLAKKEPFPNAEERRLFYVAVTRAKKHVYLIDDPAINISSFTHEILNETYEIESRGQLSKTDLCPICETGELLKKQNSSGFFYACSNYPYCKYIKRL